MLLLAADSTFTVSFISMARDHPLIVCLACILLIESPLSAMLCRLVGPCMLCKWEFPLRRTLSQMEFPVQALAHTSPCSHHICSSVENCVEDNKHSSCARSNRRCKDTSVDTCHTLDTLKPTAPSAVVFLDTQSCTITGTIEWISMVTALMHNM